MSADKSKPIFGLDKIPDNELLKIARVEIGKLNSYILELEHRLAALNKELETLKTLSPKERMKTMQEVFSNDLQRQRRDRIKLLEATLKKQEQAYSTLFNKYVLLKQERET
jgi:acyl carrier protein phosphodiesterase